MSECPRLGKLFGGCKFSPRYDESGADYPPYEGAAGAMILAMKESKSTTYVADVCETCGKQVMRQ